MGAVTSQVDRSLLIELHDARGIAIAANVELGGVLLLVHLLDAKEILQDTCQTQRLGWGQTQRLRCHTQRLGCQTQRLRWCPVSDTEARVVSDPEAKVSDTEAKMSDTEAKVVPGVRHRG